MLGRFKKWKTLVEWKSEHVVKDFGMDYSGKYISKALNDLSSNHGIAQ